MVRARGGRSEIKWVSFLRDFSELNCAGASGRHEGCTRTGQAFPSHLMPEACPSDLTVGKAVTHADGFQICTFGVDLPPNCPAASWTC